MAIALTSQADAPVARSINGEDIRWALKAGWDDYKTRRGERLLLPFVYVVVGILAAFVGWKQSIYPFLFPAAAGFALVGPIAASGFFEMARRREAGLEFGWSHFFDPLAGRSRWPIVGLMILAMGLFLAWIWIAGRLYQTTVGTLEPKGIGEFLWMVFNTSEGLRMLIWGNLTGFFFALAALVLSTFSVPLSVDKGTEPITAILGSVRVFQKNPITVLKWGAIVAVLLFVGSIPLFVGLMAVIPFLGFSTWHLYTRAIER